MQNLRTQKTVFGFGLHAVSRRLTWKNSTQATFALDNGQGKLKHFEFNLIDGKPVIKGKFKGAKQFILN